ncbi:MAG: amidohydrolase [Gemmatimonadaceae bacterium]|nr:amidohydrolase [Gemmatimonadaceae bacterium]
MQPACTSGVPWSNVERAICSPSLPRTHVPAYFRSLPFLAAVLGAAPLAAQAPAPLVADMERRIAAASPAVVAWRRDFHQNPELSNQEVRTSAKIAEQLKRMGLEVKTGVAKHGVVGILRGGKPGPVVALRADMDALPVVEEVDLPFKSTVRSTYNGQSVGVMHACGHDNHMAILLGIAEVFAGMKADLPGTVKFVFQPAEEGVPIGETGGASEMVAEGVLENPRVDAIFGLHVFPFPAGKVVYRSGGLMASADTWRMVVRGRQTHGALPWNGVDPIVIAAQIVTNMQSIVSRQTDLTLTPAILTTGFIRGGIRTNIIPDSVELGGTIRTFDEATRDSIHARFTRLATSLAAAAGGSATLEIDKAYAVTYNDPALTARMVPSLQRAVGAANVSEGRPTTTAEDFSAYQKKVPGLFFFLGVNPPGADESMAAPNHSPKFFADESALVPGMKALGRLALDYLSGTKAM